MTETQGYAADFLALSSDDDEQVPDEVDQDYDDDREGSVVGEGAEQDQYAASAAIDLLSGPASDVTVLAPNVFASRHIDSEPPAQVAAPAIKTRVAVVQGNLLQRVPDVTRA